MITCAIFGLLGVLAATPMTAQTINGSGEFSLQGRLSNSTGSPVADAEHSLEIKIYNSTSGNVVYSETDMVTTVDGVFATMIGDDGNLMLDAESDYEIGLTVNGGAELAPRLQIGDAPNAITADVAANARAVGGFTVSSSGSPEPNTLVTLNGEGRLDSTLLKGSLVTSINGMQGDIDLEVTGNGVSFSAEDGKLHLDITGGAGGDFALPFTGSLESLDEGMIGFRISGDGDGSVAAFLNEGGGSALHLESSGSVDGAAALEVENSAGVAANLVAETSSDAVIRVQNMSSDAEARLISGLNAGGEAAFEVMGSGRTMIESSGETALDVTTDVSSDAAIRVQNMSSDAEARLISGLNAGGEAAFEVMGSGRTMIEASGETALDVTTDVSSDAAIRVQNMSSDAEARLISGLNAGGEAAFEVMGSGRTMIRSTADNALDVATDVDGGNALRVDGGLALPQAAGTATLDNNGEVTINNALVDANSIIMVTVNGATTATNLTGGLQVASQSDGSFSVSLIDATLAAVLDGTVSFNYLIINQ